MTCCICEETVKRAVLLRFATAPAATAAGGGYTASVTGHRNCTGLGVILLAQCCSNTMAHIHSLMLQSWSRGQTAIGCRRYSRQSERTSVCCTVHVNSSSQVGGNSKAVCIYMSNTFSGGSPYSVTFAHQRASSCMQAALRPRRGTNGCQQRITTVHE
jgi:hypothetical protein